MLKTRSGEECASAAATANAAAAPSPQPNARPRKKLSFREPEIMGYYMQMKQNVASRLSRKGRHPKKAEEPLVKRCDSAEDLELESQAMRVVRTVGQAFEVCHKLSVNSPPNNDEEANSERESDPPTEKNKKETFSERLSLEGLGNDSSSTLDAQSDTTVSPAQRPLRLDIIPPPPQPNNHATRRSPLSGGETYTSPLGEPLKTGGGEGSVPQAGTPLSAHHEMQLLREQLDQQCQQTQAALAQVHLLRDQLAAETAARLEAQARTHQLLVHNKELLDHISALVQHLQEQERNQSSQAVTAVPQQAMCEPQTPGGMFLPELSAAQAIENRGLSFLPGACPPLFNYPYGGGQVGPDPLQRYRAQQQYLGVGVGAAAAAAAALYPPQPQFAYRVSPFGSPILTHRAPQPAAAAPSHSGQPAPPTPVRPPEIDDQFIRPLSSPSDDKLLETPSTARRRADRLSAAVATLNVADDPTKRPQNGPFIQRSTSEKVPNRSELMSQVQRTAWARHTTK